MLEKLLKQLTTIHKPGKDVTAVFRYIGPGILVTVGFIDPGNWAVNLAAGSSYGYTLLWTVTLSTIMLILLQHNVAHLGIVTGECLAEATRKFLRPWVAIIHLSTAMLAAIATALAELLGAAIALNMLFKIPIFIGAVITAVICALMLMTNSYRKLEMWIAGFVSLIAASYLFELSMVNVSWPAAAVSWVTPSMPSGSMFVVMGIIGAVIMPHNLFLHSEVIQSRKWNLEDPKLIVKQLRYEFVDTLFSMSVGWAINSAMILLAATTFFAKGIAVDELQQAQEMLVPLLGSNAASIFAVALLFAGFASTATAGMAGASIFAGMFRESYDMDDLHSKMGLLLTYIPAVIILLFITDPFYGLILSQVLLSVQLPFTIFLQLYLTSSKRVMGKYVNTIITKFLLVSIGIIVTILNLYLMWDLQ
ncbi:Divalent metal cation transporter MntH [bioreactor metagenome]|uniref:Divalent metal cation transporter MntH n=1 Tax=bioreactor metagenome TaxID=1076179 RepID=A0A644VLV5_9ZZZZ|nr:Nramp family divalent metal transporter [Acidaminococcaceae bacterium]NLU44148.1 Nramp family divalent metal transporter [Acholeplasmataceae bacterium]